MDTQGKTNIMDIQGKENTMDIQEKGSSMGIQGRKSIVGIQGEGSSVEIQGKEGIADTQGAGSSMGIRGRKSIVWIQGEGSIMDTQGKGSSVDIQGNATDIQGEGSIVEIQRKGRHHGDTGGSTIAGLPGANGATGTPGEGPADGGGQTPGAHPAVAALEVMDTLLGALAPRGPLFEKAARQALARIEGIARRDPRALLALRALLASLSRALRDQIDLHARVQGLAEALGDPLAESCAAPRDMRALAGIVGSARGRGLAYQSLYDLILACDARCGALLHRWAER